MIRRLAVAAATTCCLAFPMSAAAITPTSAVVGADSRATFNWALDPDEGSPAVYVSTTATVDERGTLDRLTEYQSLADGTSSWQTDDALHAGTYSWQVSASDADWNPRISPVQQLVVPASFRPGSPTFRCNSRKRLSLRSGWTTNVPDLKYSVRIKQGRRSMANLNYTEYLPASSIGIVQREDHDWTPMFARAFPRNATFVATIRITGPGVNFTKVLKARCR